MIVSNDDIWLASSFKTLGAILSGQGALWGFRFFNSLLTHSSVIWMSGMVLYDHFILKVSEKDSVDTSDLVEKAFWIDYLGC